MAAPTTSTARWIVRPSDPQQAKLLAAALGLSRPAAQVLVNRGLTQPDSADAFLRAPLENLSDPRLLLDLPQAAVRILTAARSGERIIIYGDYDADGVTATTIMVRGLRQIGADSESFIPRRHLEGYGLNADALRRLAPGREGDAGASARGLLVTLDCGITAIDEVDLARSLGLDVVILDHHLPHGELPRALVVGPKRPGQPAITPYAACGLAYQMVREVWRMAGVPEPPVALLDLAALGTIADVVPLVGDNRILARHGLLRMADGPSTGVAALLREVGITGAVRPRDVSFALAPRLNAAGRLDDASVAVRGLITDDQAEAAEIARYLDEENRRRQEICERVLTDAVAQVEEGHLQDGPALVLSSEGWHAGVIGIVASQLKERYGRPVIMIAVEDGIGKGSGRSIEPFPLVDALAECGDTLVRYGGHTMAAGLTVESARISDFRERFLAEAGRRLSAEDLVPAIPVDAEIRLADATPELASELERLGPFGSGNPEPVFAVRGVRAVATRIVGDGHLRLNLTDGQSFADAIGFSRGDVAELLALTGTPLDLAFSVESDVWDGQPRISLVLRDLQTPGLDIESVLADSALLLDRLFARADDYLAPALRGIEQAGSFYTKVAGVTFEGRQEVLPQVAPGESLRLVREPSNPHDPHAVAVSLPDGRKLGYLSARLAGRLAPSMDSGVRYSVSASQLTGGGDRSFGLNIFIQREELWSREVPLWQAWDELEPGKLLERLRSHFQPGRHLRDIQRRIGIAALEGDRVMTRLGPGRRGGITAILTAAAMAVRRGRPIAIVLPLASQAEAWYRIYAPVFQTMGMRAYRAHGALPLRPQQRLIRALTQGYVDILFVSAESLRRRKPPLDPRGFVVVSDEDVAWSDDVAPDIPVVRFLWGTEGAGRSDVLDDGYSRTGLRLVDRRGDDAGDLWRVPFGKEKILVFLPDATRVVELARRLRESGSGTVAYYHEGLPSRVRGAIEQLFVNGTITTLVATASFPEVFAPADIRHVIVAGLPLTRTQLREVAALAGLDGRAATVILGYRREDYDRNTAALDELYPPRSQLAALYRILRERAGREGFSWPSEPLLQALAPLKLSLKAIEAALDMLAEAGVIQREVAEGRWRIEVPQGEERRDLAASLRHSEGLREREALEGVASWAFGPASAILKALVGPIATQ